MSIKNNYHLKYHSGKAFCGSAGPEEMAHLKEMLLELTDNELATLTKNVGIELLEETGKITREDYEDVLDEADREEFYREYKKIIISRR